MGKYHVAVTDRLEEVTGLDGIRYCPNDPNRAESLMIRLDWAGDNIYIGQEDPRDYWAFPLVFERRFLVGPEIDAVFLAHTYGTKIRPALSKYGDGGKNQQDLICFLHPMHVRGLDGWMSVPFSAVGRWG